MNKYCVVRFDDVCPTMDAEQFERAFALMERYGIKPLIGVIPDNKDPEQEISPPRADFWDFIKKLQNKGYDIAMHGCIHVYDMDVPKTLICGKKHSEFAGHSYQEQYEKIRKGKEILQSHGIFTDTFFAPAHSYDKNTLKALSANGFRYLSDGLSVKPYERKGVICIPCRSFGVPRVKGKGIFVAVCHPSEWSRQDKAKGYDELNEFCEKNKEYVTTFSELKTVKCGNRFSQKISEKLFIYINEAKKILKKSKLIKTILKK